jgi:hypothetical protein
VTSNQEGLRTRQQQQGLQGECRQFLHRLVRFEGTIGQGRQLGSDDAGADTVLFDFK